MMEKLYRVRFRLHEDGLRSLMEFLCRLMPAEAITTSYINALYVSVSCYMTEAELELMRASIPELVSEDDDISETVSEFLLELEKQSKWEKGE